MSELIDRERFSADMRDFQNRVGIWRDEAEDTETRTRADAALATIIETKLILDKQPTVAAASPWHRVEDGLPDEVGSYLVYAPTYTGGSSSAKEYKAGVMFARWLKGGHWSIEVGYYKRPGCVTHWMPIEPPKEDA